MSSLAKNVVSINSADAGVPVRFVTASSLFDGHDASINIMRRILQGAGVEVIHLGHNRSVAQIVTAAIQEDVQGIAISCLLYTSPSPRDATLSRMPSSA